MSASALRANIYRLLDRVVDTGEPIEILRRGVRLKVVRVEPASKLARLTRRAGVVAGDAGELAEIDWADEWKPFT